MRAQRAFRSCIGFFFVVVRCAPPTPAVDGLLGDGRVAF
jgi:hypothetical protein